MSCRMNRVVGQPYLPRTNSLSPQTRSLNTHLVTSQAKPNSPLNPFINTLLDHCSRCTSLKSL